VRLNKSLLMLSKIENRQYADEEAINFNELVTNLAEDFTDLAEFKGISIEISNRGTLTFNMNRGLAITLVTNLFKNAMVHNHEGGSIVIDILASGFTIQNTGSSKPLDQKQVFDRFYRNSDNDQSTGLGLSIVKSISQSYKLEVGYNFNGSHSFTISFPKA